MRSEGGAGLKTNEEEGTGLKAGPGKGSHAPGAGPSRESLTRDTAEPGFRKHGARGQERVNHRRAGPYYSSGQGVRAAALGLSNPQARTSCKFLSRLR